MGNFCLIIAILTTALVLMVSQYNEIALQLVIPYTNYEFIMPLVVYTLFIFALGIFAGIMLMLKSYFESAKRYSRLKNEFDKSSVSTNENEDRIQLLENKIKTLEAALDKALGK